MATLPVNAATAQSHWLSNQWHDRLGRLLSQGKKAAVLDFIEQTIARSLPLFRSAPGNFEARRAAWLIRAQLLLEWGRPAEALAWTCLECQLAELASGHAPADAELLRDRLIRQLSLDFNPGIAANLAAESQWAGVAGMYELKASLERDVITVVRYPGDAARYGVSPPRGILLYGPPGCGKAFIARKIAEKIGFHFAEVKPGRISAIFNRAAEDGPAVLFMDALDDFAPRHEAAFPHHAAEVHEFLEHLDSAAPQRTLVIAASNYPDKIAPAVLRAGRIERYFLVGLPDFSARADMFRRHLEGQPVARLTWDGLAAQSEGYTAADIAYLCDQAARLALAESQRLIAPEETPISPPHFETAMRARKPSVVLERHTQIGFNPADGPHAS